MTENARNHVTVEIVDVFPEAEKIKGAELAVGDQVFDPMGNRYRVRRVRHFKRNTRFNREDSPWEEYIGNEETITVIRGAEPATS